MSKADYEKYFDILSSAKTNRDSKQMQPSQIEKDPAIALSNKAAKSAKVTVHYDTATRSSLDGEWPSVVLQIYNGFGSPFSPLFFAFEERQQTMAFLLETQK